MIQTNCEALKQLSIEELDSLIHAAQETKHHKEKERAHEAFEAVKKAWREYRTAAFFETKYITITAENGDGDLCEAEVDLWELIDDYV
jgi:hypothetical protein